MERIVHSQERLELMEALKQIPTAVTEATAGLGDEFLRFKPGEKEWSVREVVGHMRDKAEIWAKRLYMVASQTDPILVAFDGEASVREHNYQESSELGLLIEELRTHLLQTVDLLEHTPDWTRLGRHAEIGRRSLHQWAQYLLTQETEHLDQIESLKRQAAGARSGAPS